MSDILIDTLYETREYGMIALCLHIVIATNPSVVVFENFIYSIIGIAVLMTLILTVLYYTNRDMKWRIERLLLVFYD